jgi:hypothetical protein
MRVNPLIKVEEKLADEVRSELLGGLLERVIDPPVAHHHDVRLLVELLGVLVDIALSRVGDPDPDPLINADQLIVGEAALVQPGLFLGQL